MLSIVDGEVFHATAFVGCADKALSRVERLPGSERFPFLVQSVRVEVVSFELAIIAQFGSEVRLADT